VSVVRAVFNPVGPLPRGTTLLEASAGTGKTYAISTLVLRHVADGTPLERLLIVTFTRLATGELRARVRDRLAQAEAAMTRALAAAGNLNNAVIALLVGGGRTKAAWRLANVRRALADFDAATITTTHGFCQRVLDGLGVAGDVSRDVRFTTDLSDLRTEVADDLYLRRFVPQVDVEVPRKHLMAIARAVIGDRAARIEPASADPQVAAGARVSLARDIRSEFDRRSRAMDVMSYDDLLVRLDATLAREPGAAACRKRLADAYDVVLIDEFQDTDPLQWRIVRNGFPTQDVFLIGDPKQAIYAFRGADIDSYLLAADTAQTHLALDTTWRSDDGIVTALSHLFAGAALGDPRIVVGAVDVAPPHRGGGIAGSPDDAAVRVRVVEKDGGLVEIGARGISKPSLVDHIAADLAAQVVDLLNHDTRLPARNTTSDSPRRLVPGGIGVLVRTHGQARTVRNALTAVNVPAVITATGSVFLSPAAIDWRRLLAALERPSDSGRASAAALTLFLGWTAQRLDECEEDEREGLHATLHAWRAVLDRRGVAALVEAVMRGQGVAERALVRADGERHLTDLRHIGELLHAQAVEAQLGVSALAEWLALQVEEADADQDEERSRRLDSDANAVQVLTIHGSKGLEYDVVCLPYLWSQDTVRTDVPHIADPADPSQRLLDVGGKEGPDWDTHQQLHQQAGRAEELRLAYVALTRARHQILLWCAAHGDMRYSALGRLLMQKAPGELIEASLAKAPTEPQIRERLDALRAAAGGGISVVTTTQPPGTRYTPPAPPPVALDLARLGRGVDRAWGRHSYSALTERIHAEQVGSEPEVTPRDDDEDPPSDEDVTPVAPPVDLPMGELPGGRTFGSLVHAVLERADFVAPDLPAHLVECIEAAAAREGGDSAMFPALALALQAVLETPLGPDLGEVRLRDVIRRDRLDELQFELPLAGGDRPSGRLRLHDVADLMDRHLPPVDPAARYGERLRLIAAGQLRGFMVGAIDLVSRVTGEDGTPRFAVVDYKTNRLGGREGFDIEDYRPSALATAMHDSDYVLQALLYQVALHRYLRGRLRDYDPARHLAGAHYLFLRGMIGGSTPRHGDQPYGVFSWCPPPALITEVSDVLDRGA
jgi:exodeoxyribonuclease V beta subunit